MRGSTSDDQSVAVQLFGTFDKFVLRLEAFETIQFDARDVVVELLHDRLDVVQHVDVHAALHVVQQRHDGIDVERRHADDALEQRLEETIRHDFLEEAERRRDGEMEGWRGLL